jgi:hypothetical protein
MPWTHPGYTFFRAQSLDLMGRGDFQWFDAGAIYRGYNSDSDILLVQAPVSEEPRIVEFELKLPADVPQGVAQVPATA